MSNNRSVNNIVKFMFTFQNTIKLYHWQTKVYARHIAADNLVSKMTELIDQFVEIYIGKMGRLTTAQTLEIEIKTHTDKTIINYLKQARTFLTDQLPKSFHKNDLDLMNVRDEMLAHINQVLYLFTLE